MNASIKLEQFEGPYDLLLALISEKKLDITEISLSEVTEQFLQHLDGLEMRRAETLADFLVVGTKLLLLKSRMLLPQFAPEEDEGPSLEDQLKLYKAFLDASKKINTLWEGEGHGAFRIEPPRRPEGFVAPANLDSGQLRESMLQLINRLRPPKALPQTQIDRAITMKQKIDHVRTMLSKRSSFSFHEVLDSSQNKTEVIVGFLALLELVKAQVVGLSQDETYGDILIQRVS